MIIENIKEWAKLGDSFLNFVYSVAKTKVTGKPVGERVPNKVLSKALKLSGIKMKNEKCDKGGIVEGLLGYAWFYGIISLEEAIGIISNRISRMEYESRSLEMEILAKALSDLLEVVMNR
ncbi:MAG: ribonuclease III family protein, partial [Candidatus Methanomethyliaceae archaeon]